MSTHILGFQVAGNVGAILGAKTVGQLAFARLAFRGQIDGRLGDRCRSCLDVNVWNVLNSTYTYRCTGQTTGTEFMNKCM